MKKFFLILSICATIFYSKAQSFYKGALVIDGKLALEFYNTQLTVKAKSSGQEEYQEDQIANRNFSFGAEYGILDRLGIGASVKFNRYFADPIEYHTSIDFMALVNFHAVKGNVFNLLGGINVGGSNLILDFRDEFDTQIYGSGLYFDAHITSRIYIKRFGFQFNLAVPFVSYGALTSNDPNFNKEVIAKWQGVGFNFGVGFQYRLFSPKEKSTSTAKYSQ